MLSSITDFIIRLRLILYVLRRLFFFFLSKTRCNSPNCSFNTTHSTLCAPPSYHDGAPPRRHPCHCHPSPWKCIAQARTSQCSLCQNRSRTTNLRHQCGDHENIKQQLTVPPASHVNLSDPIKRSQVVCPKIGTASSHKTPPNVTLSGSESHVPSRTSFLENLSSIHLIRRPATRPLHLLSLLTSCILCPPFLQHLSTIDKIRRHSLLPPVSNYSSFLLQCS